MRKNALKLLALLAVFSFIAVGCGDDDDSSSASSSESSSSESSSSESSSSESSSSESSSSEEAAAEECEIGPGVSDTEIKLGSSLPLTGNLAALGVQAEFALEATIERINSGGGIAGRTISLTVQDDEFNPEKTVANAQYFIDQVGVFGVWGSIGSAPTVAAIPLHDEAGIMTLFTWSQDTSLFDREAHPYFFSLNPSGYKQAVAFSNYFGNKFDYGSETPVVAGLVLNSPDGEEAAQGVRDGAAGQFEGGTQNWERDATTYQPQLLAMKDAGVTDVYTVVGDTQFAQIIQEMDQVGLDARVWGTNAVVTSNLIDLVGELAEGALAVTVMTGLNADVPGLVQFREEMAAVGASEADLSSASMLAYSGGLVLEQALRDVGECLNADALADALLALEDFSTGGIMAPINFDPATGLGNQGAIIQQVVDGVWVTVDEG